MEFIQQYIVAALIFLLLDTIWLKFVANKLYKSEIGDLLAAKPRFGAAGVFYALYIVGIIVFAVSPALEEGLLSKAIGLGGLLGLLMYATYDLTNLATLKKWSTKLSVIDMAWGTFATAVVAAATYTVFA